MKNKVYLLVFLALSMLTFASCNKNIEVDMTHQLTINVSGADLMENYYDPFDGEPYFENGEMPDGYSIRVMVYLYDANDFLINEEERTIYNFNDIVNVSFDLPEDNYTVLAGMDVLVDDGDFWKYTSMNSFGTAKIIDGDYVGLGGLFGVYIESFTLSQAKTIAADLEHIGALMELYFSNERPDVYWYIAYNEHNMHGEYYTFKNKDFSSYKSSLLDYRYIDFEGHYIGYYVASRYLLPTFDYQVDFKMLDSEGNVLAGIYTIDEIGAKAGEHSLLTIDVVNLTYSVTPLGNKVQSNKNSLTVNSNKNTPKTNCMYFKDVNTTKDSKFNTLPNNENQ